MEDVCGLFRLNKACLKYDYPLPKIEKLVDSTAGHALLSFMDVNAEYHQISLPTEDRPHTAFITPTGVDAFRPEKREGNLPMDG